MALTTAKEDAQAARLATNATNATTQSTYGTDAQEVRDDLTTLEAAVAALQALETLADYLAADFDVDSGTTGDTPTATGLSVTAAAGTYILEAVLFCTATTNGGIELSLSAPAESSATWAGVIEQASDNVVNDGENDLTGALNYIAAALSFDAIRIYGRVTVASAGAVAILGAQDTAHADNTLIHEGSWLKLTPVNLS